MLKMGVTKSSFVLLLLTLYRFLSAECSLVRCPTRCPNDAVPPPRPTCPASFGMFVRFATFNISFNRFNEGDLKTELASPGADQPTSIAKVIQSIRPDVVLLNEFDYDDAGEGLANFVANYLEVSLDGSEPISYPYSFAAPSNTGVPSGFDYDNNDDATGPGDAYGFGFFPGQYGMALLSKYPIDMDNVRTFQKFLWKDMPCALLPKNEDFSSYYEEGPELDSFRLSSKSHWDVPVMIGDSAVHILASHPTPPVFDGPEDRNGKRNHDEVRFWADYISGKSYFYDDNGGVGGISDPDDAMFVIVGDLNADPFDGDSYPGTAQLLLDHPAVYTESTPYGPGGIQQAELTGGMNAEHCADPRFDTADFNDQFTGNLRADYCLPSANMNVVGAQIVWPLETDPLFNATTATDHRMVYIDAIL